VTFRVPAEAVDPIDTVIKVELEQPWTTAAVVPVPDAAGEQGRH
jgi:hypothetical protein